MTNRRISVTAATGRKMSWLTFWPRSSPWSTRKKKRVLGIDAVYADGCRLEARLRLAPCRSVPQVDIKSVTYHNLHVREHDGMKSAAIVFDV